MPSNSLFQLVTVASISLLTGCCIGALVTLPANKDVKPKSAYFPFQSTFLNRMQKKVTSSTSISTSTSLAESPSTTDYISDDELSGENGEDEEDEDAFVINSTPLNEIPGECRMALVIRTDLGMQKGKIAAQCCHAALSCYRLMSEIESEGYNPVLLKRWTNRGQAKITLKCKDMDEMDLLYAKAMSLSVNAYIVHDAGRTQIEAGSATVLGLGPAPKTILDQITGDLKLY